jgi:hypothetical protein
VNVHQDWIALHRLRWAHCNKKRLDIRALICTVITFSQTAM